MMAKMNDRDLLVCMERNKCTSSAQTRMKNTLAMCRNPVLLQVNKLFFISIMPLGTDIWTNHVLHPGLHGHLSQSL